jgi:hypothetical protein
MGDNQQILKWNGNALLGWVNVALGGVVLSFSLFGNTGYWMFAGAFCLIIGGLLVSFSGPLKEESVKLNGGKSGN